MDRYKKFIILWIVDSLLLLMSVAFLPLHFALGNSFFSTIQAALFVGVLWNLAIWYTDPFFKDLEIKLIGATQMMMGYLFMNFAALWILARLAVITGFGVSSWIYVLGLAVVGNFVQYFFWQYLNRS